jgi:hypothetical protein
MDATLAFKNPKRDSVLYLHADNPGTVFTEPQNVTIQLNGQSVDTMTVTPRNEQVHRTKLTAAQFGMGDMAEVRLEVDKTYVPASRSPQSKDPRELGVRIFHAFVEPH